MGERIVGMEDYVYFERHISLKQCTETEALDSKI